MKYFKLILKQNNKRLLFTLIGLLISSVILFTALYYTESIKDKIKSNIALGNDEYSLYINEHRFESINQNYYEILNNSFDLVVPFNITEKKYNDITYKFIATDIKKEILYLDGLFIEGSLIKKEISNEYPNIVIVSNKEEDISVMNILGITYNIEGTFIIDTIELSNNIFLMDYDTYTNYIDPNIIKENYGYFIEKYFIKSSFDNKQTLSILKGIYDDDFIHLYVDSYESLFNEALNSFLGIPNFAIIIFVLVGLFSFISIFVAINLTIQERKKYYAILSICGMNFKDLKKMILTEIFILSVITSILSYLISLLITIVILNITELNFVGVGFIKVLGLIGISILIPVIQTFIAIHFIKYKNISKLSLA